MAFMEMRLTEKRRALAEIRKRWRESTPDNPLFLSSRITDTPHAMSISNFCLAFEYLHHMKRHEKSLRGDGTAGEDGALCDDSVAAAPPPDPQPAPAWFAASLKPDDTDPTKLWAEPAAFPPHFHTAGKRVTRSKRSAAAAGIH